MASQRDRPAFSLFAINSVCGKWLAACTIVAIIINAGQRKIPPLHVTNRPNSTYNYDSYTLQIERKD